MTFEDMIRERNRPHSDHGPFCEWHEDQIWWQCNCGAIDVLEIRRKEREQGDGW